MKQMNANHLLWFFTNYLWQIIHRDVAARNMLVGEQETCKVSGFKMARDVHQENIYRMTAKVCARFSQSYEDMYT